MTKIPCSVPILTLNRKKDLERLLPSIVDVFEDVFIMDGNSTDGTQEYARSLGIRIEKQFDTDAPNQPITDFGAMRVKLASKSHCDWMMVLDSDEEVTEEYINRIRALVAEDRNDAAYSFYTLTKLPDGRIVKHALYYPYKLIRLFKRSTGVSIGGRVVHERFTIPPGIIVHQLPEYVLSPQPSAKEWRARQLKYLEKEASMISSTSWSYFWRWIVWYNVRSFFGQLLKTFNASLAGFLRGEVALPWSYSSIFLEYRIRSMFSNGRAWALKRKQAAGRIDHHETH
jgi:glycosyltransferase involved in cell wall biosynthesis